MPSPCFLRRARALAILSAFMSHAALAAQPESNAAPPPLGIDLLVDRSMSVAAGAATLVSLQRTLASLEDRVLSPRLFEEATLVRRALGISYRAAKFLALDLPQDHFLLVLGHEVFGHGSRLREIGAPVVRHRFDLPIPYGRGGGVTSFASPQTTTRAERLSIATSGIEAQNLMADLVGRRVLAARRVHYREAWLYLESRLGAFRYLRSVSPRSRPSHDVAAFLADFNEGCDVPACRRLDERTVKRRALVMLADPLLAFAAYGLAVNSLFLGRPWAAMPAIRLGDRVRYLPSARFDIAPYGSEWQTTHHLAVGERQMVISLRFGDAGRRRPWGAGIVWSGVLRPQPVRAAVRGNLWRQPPLDAPPTSPVLRTGGLAAMELELRVGRRRSAGGGLSVSLEGGYKSDGFVPGEALRRGPIVRAGLGYAWQ